MKTPVQGLALGLLWSALCLGGGAVPAAANDWEQIGITSRPSWVAGTVERRLRLLDSLKAIEDDLVDEATGYIGGHGPGLSVGLTLTDGLYYSRGFGFRDAAKTKTPDEFTVFCIGSFTKVFTGTALLALRDAGELSLDDPVSDYVPEINQVGCPGGGCPTVRLKHLVSHTAGLPNEMSPAVVDQATWLNELEHTKFNYFAGKYSAYSGVAVETAGLVVERQTGKPYRQAVRDLLLTPLAMNQSTFDLSTVAANRRSQNYDVVWNESATGISFVADSVWNDPLALTAAGYLLSSVRDVARFNKIWIAEKAPNDFLKPTSLQAARTALLPASPSPIKSDCEQFDDGHNSSYSECGNATAFGVNWYIGTPGILTHNGSTGKCGSDTVIDPDHHLGVTALISTNPYPAVPDPDHQTQPPSVDAGFISTVVDGVVAGTKTADVATDWQGKRLATGVARYLYLLGVKIPLTGGAAVKQNIVDQFTPAFRTAHNLTTGTAEQFIKSRRNKIGACSIFRVRGVPNVGEVNLRLACAKGTDGTATSWDVTVKVELAATHRISDIKNEGAASDPY